VVYCGSEAVDSTSEPRYSTPVTTVTGHSSRNICTQFSRNRLWARTGDGCLCGRGNGAELLSDSARGLRRDRVPRVLRRIRARYRPDARRRLAVAAYFERNQGCDSLFVRKWSASTQYI